MVVLFADARIEPHAVVIELIDALVAKFAMHRFRPHLDIAYPALFGGFLRIDATVGVGVVVFGVQQSWIGRIDFHRHVSKKGRGHCKAAKDYRAQNRRRQREHG